MNKQKEEKESKLNLQKEDLKILIEKMINDEDIIIYQKAISGELKNKVLERLIDVYKDETEN